MKLNKYQVQALGIKKQAVPEYVWNSKMSSIYQKIDRKNKEMEDEGQTYLEFLEMEKQEPNQQGTGRYKFEIINKIQYFFISKGMKKIHLPTSIKDRINRLLSVYLRLPTEHNSKIQIYLKGNKMIDKVKGIEYSIRREQSGLDVYDLLDVMMEYREDSTILVALIEQNLQEEGNQLDGRACGDGVAVVGFNKNDLQSKFDQILQTLLHQTLHTLGFDHCIAWKCLMNAWTNFEAWLCPACSRKLYHQLKIKSKKDACNWVKGVTETLFQIKSYKNAKKGRDLVQNLSQQIDF